MNAELVPPAYAFEMNSSESPHETLQDAINVQDFTIRIFRNGSENGQDKSAVNKSQDFFSPIMSPAMSCLPNEKSQTLQPLYFYMEEIKRPHKNSEFVARKCRKGYEHNPSFLIDCKEVQKFLPNINIKREERLLKLFGVEILNVKDPKDPDKKLYTIAPYQYILATMVNSVSYSNFEHRIQFAFKMYDYDGDGKISHKDLRELFTFYGKESNFALTEDIINSLVDAISEDIEKDEDGMISLKNFKQFFEKFEGEKAKINIFERGRAPSASKKRTRLEPPIESRLDIEERGCPSPTKPTDSFKSELSPGYSFDKNESVKKLNHSFLNSRSPDQSHVSNAKKSEIVLQSEPDSPPKIFEEPFSVEAPEEKKTFLQGLKNKLYVDGAKWLWLAIWFLGAVFDWIWHFKIFYAHTGVIFVGIAKGCAGVVSYNMGIMFFLVTKSITTVLRMIGIAHLLPLNFNVYFHRILGITTLICGIVHSCMHIGGSYFALAGVKDVDTLNSLLHSPVDEIKPYSWWLLSSMPSVTGYPILIMMIILVICALKKYRKKNYERFWYSHYMWLALVVLLILHGSKAYVAPQEFMYWVGFPSVILAIEKLIALFNFCSGRFKILDLSYISSDLIELKVSKPKSFKFVPGQYALINIKTISPFQWHPFSYSSGTSDDFLTFHISPVGDWTKSLKELAISFKKNKIPLPDISLMGPYGAPSQHYKDYKNLMIFCTGVGATPFASILKEFIHKALEEKEFRDYSIDFYWLCRNPSSHGWLSKLFVDLQSEQQGKQIVKINMFFTSPHERFDLRMFLLWIGLNKLYEKGVRVNGLEHFNIMHWGRPNWDEVFAEKRKEVKKGTVGVFFCGNSLAAKEIHRRCCKYSKNVLFKFSKEIY